MPQWELTGNHGCVIKWVYSRMSIYHIWEHIRRCEIMPLTILPDHFCQFPKLVNADRAQYVRLSSGLIIIGGDDLAIFTVYRCMHEVVLIKSLKSELLSITYHRVNEWVNDLTKKIDGSKFQNVGCRKPKKSLVTCRQLVGNLSVPCVWSDWTGSVRTLQSAWWLNSSCQNFTAVERQNIHVMHTGLGGINHFCHSMKLMFLERYTGPVGGWLLDPAA